jgi:hypothetical protein
MTTVSVEQEIKSLKPFQICQFRDIYHNEYKLHRYIKIPYNKPDKIILCIFTSQIKSVEKRYIKFDNKSLNSLVYVTPLELPFLEKPTIIDCHEPNIFTKDRLIRHIDKDIGFKIKIEENIPDKIKDKLIYAILNSPIVSPETLFNIPTKIFTTR